MGGRTIKIGKDLNCFDVDLEWSHKNRNNGKKENASDDEENKSGKEEQTGKREDGDRPKNWRVMQVLGK